jgi:hypothetical protein
MYRYVFLYEPVWGVFTQMVEYVMANSIEQAKIKFYSTEAGNNCARLIEITKDNFMW